MSLGSVSEKVYQHLKAGIIDGTWQDHERINEQQLAKHLAVSRTSIRKALKVLEGEGLVRSIDNKGMIVTYITERDVQEVYQCRLALETEWYRQVQGQISSQAIRTLLARLNQLKRLEEAGQDIDIWQVEREFYRHLACHVDLPVYEEMLAVAFDRLRFLQVSHTITARQQQVYLRYYRQLLLCLTQANQQILIKLVRQALNFSQELALACLKHEEASRALRDGSVSGQADIFVCSENDCPLLTAFMRPL